MITPSDLVPCVRSLSDQSFFLNPGRLTKGRGGGSFALVQFNSNGHKVRINKIWFMHLMDYIKLYQSYSMTHANKLLQQIICRTLPYSIKLNYDNESRFFQCNSDQNINLSSYRMIYTDLKYDRNYESLIWPRAINNHSNFSKKGWILKVIHETFI